MPATSFYVIDNPNPQYTDLTQHLEYEVIQFGPTETITTPPVPPTDYQIWPRGG